MPFRIQAPGMLTDDLPASIVRAISESEVQCLLRRDHPQTWDRALAGLHYLPVAYSSASIDYQLEYQRGHGGNWWDLSLILCRDNVPCGIWPLSVSERAGQMGISSHGLPLLPPLFTPELSGKSRKNLMRGCLSLWDELRRVGTGSTLESVESFCQPLTPAMSEWHDQSMRRGARAFLQHELYVDLGLGIDEIKAHFRKSYKPLISSGLKMWRVEALPGPNATLWDQFRALHLKVAGRSTRSADSWRLQEQAIVAGDAFLISLMDQNHDMVGGGFFNITRDEGAYAVGAYDRSLFDKPLGHVVQFRAIEEMKRRGLRWYKIGLRPYPADDPTPTDKELSIGEFKDGFATHIFPRHVLRHVRSD